MNFNQKKTVFELIKYVVVIIVSVLAMFIINKFLTPNMVGIKLVGTDGYYNSYEIEYSNGKKQLLSIKNGEDGKDVSVQELYEATKLAKQSKGEDVSTYTILDFVNEYLNFSVEQKDEAKAYMGLLSTVKVYAQFPTSEGYFGSGTTYSLSMGAGVIYEMNGDDNYYILTNYHVVYNAQSILSQKISDKIVCYSYGTLDKVVVDENNKSYEFSGDAIKCEYVGGSMNYDIAVLKVLNKNIITSKNKRPVTVNKDDLVVGETVVAIGNPEGYGISATKGVVSVDSEYQVITASDNVSQIQFRAIRMDASVNGGNSGGGLFNTDGELVGIVNSKIQKEGVEGMGFALPTVITTRVADNIIKNNVKTPKKAVLGLTIEVVERNSVYDTENMTIKINEKIKIQEKSADSICDGLQVNDIIKQVKIGDVTYDIDRNFRLTELVWLMNAGDTIYFTIERLGVTVGSIPVIITANCFQEVA